MKQRSCANCDVHFVADIAAALSKEAGRKKIMFLTLLMQSEGRSSKEQRCREGLWKILRQGSSFSTDWEEHSPVDFYLPDGHIIPLWVNSILTKKSPMVHFAAIGPMTALSTSQRGWKGARREMETRVPDY